MSTLHVGYNWRNSFGITCHDDSTSLCELINKCIYHPKFSTLENSKILLLQVKKENGQCMQSKQAKKSNKWTFSEFGISKCLHNCHFKQHVNGQCDGDVCGSGAICVCDVRTINKTAQAPVDTDIVWHS